jgi:hypothetical protein
VLISACRQRIDPQDYVHQSRGHVKSQGDNAPRVHWSSAGYQARSPFGDINIVQVRGALALQFLQQASKGFTSFLPACLQFPALKGRMGPSR